LIIDDLQKISFSLHIGLVGIQDAGKDIILEFFKEKAIETNYDSEEKTKDKIYEFFLVFKDFPINLKMYLAETIQELTFDYETIKRLDIVILALNLYNLSSKNKYMKEQFEEFIEEFMFSGISVLLGLDVELILKGTPSKEFRISKYNLVQKAKELDILYCFEILNKKGDLQEFYNKLLGDFTFKFQFTNPEILEKAREYGKTLIKQ